MRRFVALLRWELRLQLRAPRTRAAIGIYVALCALPEVVWLQAHDAQGSATLLAALLGVQPFLTLVLTALVAGHRSGAAAWPETWPVLASASLGNAGYLLGRWLSVVAIVLPVTAVPMVAGVGIAAAAGYPWQDGAVWAWVGSWALRVVPLVFVAGAMWLGMVTILGSELAALAATVVGVSLALAALNEVLLHFRLLVEASPTLGASADFARAIFRITHRGDAEAAGLPATEAPFDARAVAEWTAPRLLVGAALAALVLGLAVAYVRRTRRDLAPRPVRPDHPLRTYLLLFLRLRDHLAPSAALSRSDLLAMGCGVLLLAAGLGLDVGRQRHYQRLAGVRYATEKGDPFAPLAREVVPRSWSIRGAVELSGAVALEVSSTLHNQGGEPRTRLAFTLNENLEVAAVEAPGRRTHVERAWNRLRLTLEPPLAADESLEIRWQLRGTPAEIELPLWGYRGDTFVTQMDRFRQARFVRELSDLSKSRPIRAASPRRVGLEAASLAPVPRYTPWTLELVDRGSGSWPEVPREIVVPEAEVSIELAAPSRVFLADVCGHSSRAEGSRSVLRGRCRTPLAEYGVVGGRLAVQEMGIVVLATLESHRPLVASLGETLARAARLSEKAWPGMKGFGGLVVVEWLPYFKKRLDTSRWFWGQYLLRGRLLLVHEGSYLFPMGGERLVADLMTRDLIARRPIAPGQELFFRRAFAALMLRRMGLARQQDAVVASAPWLDLQLATPLLEGPEHSLALWVHRLPAVLADLEARLGSQQLFDGFEKFLSRGGEAGTVEELLAVLEEEAGVSLERFYRDFIAGSAVPRLTLESVESRREERGYRVTGQVKNSGTGEVICPVLVKTETGAIRVMVTVDSASAAPFDVRTTSRPHTVELDPGGTCHRLVTRTREAAEKVDLLG